MAYADNIRNAVAPQAGVVKSDTGQSRLDAGLKDFLARMGDKQLGDLYNYWASAGIWHGQDAPPIIGSGDTDNLKQLDSMSFGFMDGCAKGLDNLANAGKQIGSTATDISSRMSAAWSDKAGQAAADRFGDLQKASGDYQESVQNLATAMHAVWKGTTQAVQTLANFPKGADNEQGNVVGGNGGARFMGLYGTDDKWNVAQWKKNIDAIKHLLTVKDPTSQDMDSNNYVDPNSGHNFTPQELATPGTVMVDGGRAASGDKVQNTYDLGLGDIGADHLHSDQVIQKMNDFNNNYAAVVKNFRAQITLTINNVRDQMSNLEDSIKSNVTNTDPFGKLSVTVPASSPGGQPSGGTSSGSGGGGRTSGGGGGSASTSAASFSPPPTSPSTVGAGGGGGAAPTGGAPAGAGAMPTIPPISTPVGSTGTTTSSATGMPGTGTTGLPGTGTTGLPGSGTGLPGSTGMPGSTPETLTVQSGGNTIGMSTPDSQGNVQLTVTNANGQPQSYDIGFGQGQGATGAPGAPGQPGMADSTAMQPTTGFGPTGTPMDPSQLAGSAGVQHITPGPDGSAVIHDGNLTITATEPQGHSGPVQVTVDDGTGHPSTYTLGGGDPTGGASQMQPLTGQPTTDPSSLSGYGDPSSVASSTTAGFTDPSSLQSDPSTSASAWLSPDAANQAHTAAAVTPDVGGTVSGHVGDASSLVGGGGGGGGVGLAAMSGGAPGGGDIHSVLGGAVDHAAGTGDVSGVGLAGTDVTNAAAPGGAGLAAGPNGGGQASGGMPMMGGMGGMGGGGQGGDTERGASQWRTQGHLFDNVMDDNPASGFSGVLGEETREQGR